MVSFSTSLLAVGLIAGMLALSGPATAGETGPLDTLRQQATDLVNKARRNRNLQPLTLGPALNKAAQNHAEDMLRRNYYSHVSPEGDTVRDRYMEAGGSGWTLTEENIARCQGCSGPPDEDRVRQLQKGWMDSPEHRANILRKGIDRFGFGIVAGSGDTLYAVQTFAGPGTSHDLQPNEAPQAIGRERQSEIAARKLNRLRRKNGAPTLEAAEALVQAAADLLPDQAMASFESARLDDMMKALPEGARGDWQSLAAVMGACGGCGTAPNAADVRFFLQQWFDNPQYRDRLLDRTFTDFGFVVRANGEGLKTALLVLGERR